MATPTIQSGSVYPLDQQVTVSYNGVDYKFWDEGTKEVFDRQGSATQAVQTIVTLWGDRLPLIVGWIGVSDTSGGGNIFSYGRPYPYIPALVCSNAQTEGLGLKSVDSTTQTVAYQYARIVLTYKTNQLQTTQSAPGVGFLELDNQSNYITLSGSALTNSSFKWNTGPAANVPANQVPVLTIKTTKITIQKETAVLQESLYLQLQNNTNTTATLGAAPGTMIFWGARSHRKIMPNGAANWTVTLSFEYNATGWSKLYRPPDATGWAGGLADVVWIGKDTLGNVGGPLYATADLNTLLT